MNQEKGLTLIEVLASVILLAVAVTSITFLVQNSTLSSKSTTEQDELIMVTRTVMEEIKHWLSDDTELTVEVYNQTINLEQLRSNDSAVLLPIYFPNSANQRYVIQVRSLKIPLTDNKVEIAKKPYELDDFFRHIVVEATHIQSNKKFELEAFVEYNN